MSNKELIAVLLERNSALEELVKSQAGEIASLKAELAWYKANRNSHNSHLPPSRDLHKPIPPKPKRKKSKRNPEDSMATELVAYFGRTRNRFYQYLSMFEDDYV